MHISHRSSTAVIIIASVLTAALTVNVVNFLYGKPRSKPIQAVELVNVKILEACRELDINGQSRPWWLIEVEDGQRCYIHNYLGKPGDSFVIWSDKLEGYRRVAPDGIQLSPVASAHAEAPAKDDLPKVVITGVPPIVTQHPAHANGEGK